MAQTAYDRTTAEGILAHARLLLGKSLRDLYPEAVALAGKGGLGQCVEKFHFDYQPNSTPEPDFPEAGVELKCTPMKRLQDGSMVAKERLVLNIINYVAELDARFETSSFSKKNALLLLMFYLHLAGVDRLDFVFRIVRLWKIPKADLKIFMDDWAVIHKKIEDGLAHELSEGDTLYLAAVTKGQKGGADKRPQPRSPEPADQRAYSIKAAYMNHIIVDSLSHPEMCAGLEVSVRTRREIEKRKADLGSVIRSLRDYRRGETFEQLVHRKFARFFGKSVREIAQKLGVSVSASPKAVSYSVCRAILGVKASRIAEFEKAGVQLKTIRLEPNGGLREAMSFQNIRYGDIIHEEDWEESDWHDTISRRFFFIVFRKKAGGGPLDAVLENAFFWAMPRQDMEEAEAFWRDTRDKVRDGDYNHFLKQSENRVCHVRPKAKNAADTTPTPQGGQAKKYCYWLNRPYVLGIVRSSKSPAPSQATLFP
jgi:DNA mismatch repair protein MutH